MITVLDHRAAFIIFNHSIHVERLKVTFGGGGTALEWSPLYVCNHSQSVSVTVLVALCLHQVPLSVYPQPLWNVISDHDCNFQKYVDDTELSQSAPPDEFQSVQSGIQTCIDGYLSGGK